jgi:hypothetical protein
MAWVNGYSDSFSILISQWNCSLAAFPRLAWPVVVIGVAAGFRRSGTGQPCNPIFLIAARTIGELLHVK